MFHIAVENVKHNNWYTEKIGEAFSTKTLPIYWGCPNIDKFGYDERGIIRFNNTDELIEIVNEYIKNNNECALIYFRNNFSEYYSDFNILKRNNYSITFFNQCV